VKKVSFAAISRKPFVVLAYPRTGSYLLVSLLQQFQGLRCYGEIFKRKALELPSEDIKAIGANLASRNAEPFVFLKQLFQLYPDQHCGFKFFPNHHADVLTWVTWSNQINRVVILRNPFEMYVSFSRVSATGIWVDKHNKAKHRQPRIKFQAESFDKMMRNILNAQKLFKTTAEKRPESTITITYDEIAALEPVRQLAAFLGAASQPTKLEVPLRKQTTERYSELFENFDELASHMRRNYPNICIDKHKL
jgi:LPS sulfotransferase NodH